MAHVQHLTEETTGTARHSKSRKACVSLNIYLILETADPTYHTFTWSAAVLTESEIKMVHMVIERQQWVQQSDAQD